MKPYIKLNSLYITPMEFEDYLNKSPDLFYFVGKITQSSARKYNEGNYFIYYATTIN